MKSLHLLTGVLAVGLLVLATSCAAPGYADDYYSPDGGARNYGNRVYVDDPYRGTVVLERDPYTGRYYEVSRIGSPYGNYPAGGYYGGGGYYGNRYPSQRVYRNYPARGQQTTQPPRQQPQPQPQQDNSANERARQEAREKVLGSRQ